MAPVTAVRPNAKAKATPTTGRAVLNFITISVRLFVPHRRSGAFRRPSRRAGFLFVAIRIVQQTARVTWQTAAVQGESNRPVSVQILCRRYPNAAPRAADNRT